MKINYFIDKIQISILDSYTHLCINGWAVGINGEIPHFYVNINDKEENMEIVTIPRRDVCKKYNFDNASLQCGFRIVVNSIKPVNKISLIANIGENSSNILDLDKKNIDKISNTDTVEYSIDSVSYDKDRKMTIVSGWAISYYKEDILYKIENAEGNIIDSTIRVINREDLYRLKMVDLEGKYCGFMISFSSLENEKNYLTIESATFKKKIDLSDVNKVSKLLVAKEYIKAINSTNVTKGVKYLKENGPIKFLKRLKQGPGGYTMSYAEWFENNCVSEIKLREQKNHKFEYNPLISIIVPTYNTPVEFLKEMMESVINQSYSNWQLCIADGSDPNNKARSIIEDYTKKDNRIIACYLEENYGISGNTNKAL